MASKAVAMESMAPSTPSAELGHLLSSHQKGSSITVSDVTFHIESKVFPEDCTTAAQKAKAALLGGKVIKKKEILKGISGVIQPGTMTALLGPSGAGKSTFLDIIAGRKNSGVVGGRVLFNGKPAPKVSKRLLAYVEQIDILPETMTVREVLDYQARFKTTLGPEDRASLVQKIIQDLALVGCADSIVGGKGAKGISGGQLKRLNIGCELVTSPHLILLDEPTSGLDSSAALNVGRIMRDLADQGTTCVATIHQPSQEVFELFDNVVILQEGEVAFWGTRERAIDFVAEATGTRPQPHDNPCDWLIASLNDRNGGALKSSSSSDIELDFSGEPANSQAAPAPSAAASSAASSAASASAPAPASASASTTSSSSSSSSASAAAPVFIPEVFRGSKFATSQLAQVQAMAKHSAQLPPAFDVNESVYAHNWFLEFGTLVSRFVSLQFRDQDFVAIRIFAKIAISILVGSLYYDIDLQTQKGVGDAHSMIFFLVSMCGFATMDFLPGLFKDRVLFTKERLSGCYRVSTYLFSAMFVEAIIAIISTSVYLITYFMAGLPSNFTSAANFLVSLYPLYLWALFFAYFLSSVFSSFEAAISGAPLVMLILFLLSGFLIRDPPAFYSWIQDVNPFTFSLEGAAKAVFSGIDLGCSESELVNGFCPFPTGDAYLKANGLADISVGGNAAYLCIVVAITGVLAYTSLRFFQHIKR